MKLEQQVVSLEIAKRLKELGVKQESLFWWEYNGSFEYKVIYGRRLEDEKKSGRYISAFTVAELGEMLREEESELPTYLSSTHEWVAVYETTLIGGAETEADARGKMFIYLLENKLI